MIRTPLVTLEKIGYALGEGKESLFDLASRAVENLGDFDAASLGGVLAATFSNDVRFPSLAVRIATKLALPARTPAFDLQMACSAYPYALYLAGKMAADLERRILVIDGDCQSPLVDENDHATGHIFSDAVTATIVSASAEEGESAFDFLSRYDEALRCPSAGPIFMDGMKVFTFVATEVRVFLKDFLVSSVAPVDAFVPHQANPYMVRQLAKSLSLEDKLVTLDESVKNPGSASIPLTLATRGVKGDVLLAGFGAGYSAGVARVRVK